MSVPQYSIMDLQTLYKNLDVSHLSVDEVEHELLIRNILFDLDEHESKKRRKLKDKMKSEKEKEGFVASPIWRKIKEEIQIIEIKLKIIEDLLGSPKMDDRKRQKLKTRLVHYRVRTFLLAKASGASKHMSKISGIGQKAGQIFEKHFGEIGNSFSTPQESTRLETDISQALNEVRNEIETLNETASGKDLEEEAIQFEEEGNRGKNVIEMKKKKIETSLKRSEEIMEKLSEYEEGTEKDPTDLIKIFKQFVLQSTEQQKEMRKKEIAAEEKRMKEAEENIERKKRLEQLLLKQTTKKRA